VFVLGTVFKTYITNILMHFGFELNKKGLIYFCAEICIKIHILAYVQHNGDVTLKRGGGKYVYYVLKTCT